MSDVAITPDGKYVVSGSWDDTLKVWDLENGEEKATLEGHEEGVNAVAITPDGKHAISGSRDRTIKVWDLVNEACISVFEGDNSFKTLNFLPDRKTIIAGDISGKVHILYLDKQD